MSTLFQASAQWANRPADQRFWTLGELRGAALRWAERSAVATVRAGDLRFDAEGGEVLLTGSTGSRALLSHAGFDAVSRLAGAPPAFLRTLRPATAAAVLEERFGGGDPDRERELLLLRREDDRFLVRGATGTGFVRIWNHEVATALLRLEDAGWRVAPARPNRDPRVPTRKATAADCIDWGTDSVLTIKPGDEIAPAGLYCSDSDLFVFLVYPNCPIETGGATLHRGLFVWNSEPGGRSIGGMHFLLDYVCGNHIVWGASEVTEFRFSHVGEVRDHWGSKNDELAQYASSSAAREVRMIETLRSTRLAETEDDLRELMLSKRLLPLNVTNQALELAKQYDHVNGDPLSAWGFVAGLTRRSQQHAFQDQRVALDRSAGKILEMVTK